MDEYKSFLKQYNVRNFAKGEIILCEGEVPEYAYVIRHGVIKTYNITIEGQEKPISFDMRGEVFPIGWVFGVLRSSQYFYSAFTDVQLYVIPREDYINFVQTASNVVELFTSLVKGSLDFQMRVNALEQSKATEKVVYTLHFLSIKFGQETKDGSMRIQLPLTQQDLANYMGLTRETTGIELKKLEKLGAIDYNRQSYILHKGVFNKLVDEKFGYIIRANSHKKPNSTLLALFGTSF